MVQVRNKIGFIKKKLILVYGKQAKGIKYGLIINSNNLNIIIRPFT